MLPMSFSIKPMKVAEVGDFSGVSKVSTPALLVCVCGVRRLVSGAGDIKLTKDGNVLLHEMVIGHF